MLTRDNSGVKGLVLERRCVTCRCVWSKFPTIELGKRIRQGQMKGNLLYQTAFLLGIMIAIVLGVGLMLPNTFEVERTTIVETSPDKVFGLLGDLKQWPLWDPWTRSDPGIKQSFEGQPGVGQVQTWLGPKSGEGSLKIIESSLNSKLVLTLKGRSRSESQAMVFELEDLGGRTRVRWNLSGLNRWRPLGNIFGLGMESFLGPIYEAGLENLKTVAEGGTLKDPVQPEG